MTSDHEDRPLALEARLLVWLVAAGGLLVWTTTCAHSRDEQELVGNPISGETREAVDAGEAEVTEALSSFILETDNQVCRSDEGRRAAQDVRQAMSEAYLELTRAIEKSKRTARANRPGEAPSPDEADEDDENTILWMSHDTADDAPAPQLRWQCHDAAEHRACVESTANSLARLLYQSKFDGHSLEPSRVAEILPVIARDLRWAFEQARDSRDSPPRSVIRDGCEAGDSPLEAYLGEHADETSISQIRGQFTGEHPNFCAGLAATYGDLLDTLRGRLEQALISQRCPRDDWEAL